MTQPPILSWHPACDATIYFDPALTTPSSITTQSTKQHLEQHGQQRKKRFPLHSQGGSKPQTLSHPHSHPVANITQPIAMQKNFSTPNPNASQKSSSTSPSANHDFKLHYKKQDVFGSLPKSKKIVVDIANNVKPWEPTSPLNPQDYLSKSNAFPANHTSPSRGHNFNGTSLSFGSTSARNLAIGLVKDGVGNEQILTVENMDSSRGGHLGQYMDTNSTNSNKNNNKQKNPNLFVVDFEMMVERRQRREQEARLHKLQSEGHYHSPLHSAPRYENNIHNFNRYDQYYDESVDKHQHTHAAREAESSFFVSDRWYAVTRSLWIEIVVVPGQEHLESVRNFLNALSWRVNGDVSDEEMAFMWGEYCRKGRGRSKTTAAVGAVATRSAATTERKIVPLTYFRSIVWSSRLSEPTVDLYLAIMINERNKTLLLGNQHIRMTPDWLVACEALFFSLDDEGNGFISIDEMRLLSSVLLRNYPHAHFLSEEEVQDTLESTTNYLLTNSSMNTDTTMRVKNTVTVNSFKDFMYKNAIGERQLTEIRRCVVSLRGEYGSSFLNNTSTNSSNNSYKNDLPALLSPWRSAVNEVMENLDGVGDLISEGGSNDGSGKSDNHNYLPKMSNFLLVDAVGFVQNQDDMRNILEDNDMRNQIATDLTNLFRRQYQKVLSDDKNHNDKILENLSTTAYHVIFRCLDSLCEKIFYSALELTNQIRRDKDDESENGSEEGAGGRGKKKANIAKYFRNIDTIFNYRLDKYLVTKSSSSGLVDSGKKIDILPNSSNNSPEINISAAVSSAQTAGDLEAIITTAAGSNIPTSISSSNINSNVAKVANTWKGLKSRNKFKAVVDMAKLSPVNPSKGWQSPHRLNMLYNASNSVDEGTQTANTGSEGVENFVESSKKYVNMLPNQKRCLIFSGLDDAEGGEESDDDADADAITVDEAKEIVWETVVNIDKNDPDNFLKTPVKSESKGVGDNDSDNDSNNNKHLTEIINKILSDKEVCDVLLDKKMLDVLQNSSGIKPVVSSSNASTSSATMTTTLKMTDESAITKPTIVERKMRRASELKTALSALSPSVKKSNKENGSRKGSADMEQDETEAEKVFKIGRAYSDL